MLEVYQKFRQSTLVGLPEKILHFTITETLQMAICLPNVMHVEQRILHQRNIPQGNFTI